MTLCAETILLERDNVEISRPSPLFSFVAASRNDDHGGDVLRRTQSFVRFVALQAKRHQVRCELVLVDWNPPRGRLPLADVLDWPRGDEWFSAKVVTVPHDLHLTLPNARSMAMFQMIAKNVGLRRATGDYLIATNIDIIFSDELFEWLKTTPLDPNTLYRSDRWDIPNEIQLEQDFDHLLHRARTEAIRMNLREGTHVRDGGEWIAPKYNRLDVMLTYSIEHSLETIQRKMANHEPVEHLIADLLDTTIPTLKRYYQTPNVHPHGCGDFTMMSPMGWEKTRGYPEWPIFSWNIDTVGITHAVYQGLGYAEAPADAVHYHIEHDHGSGYTPEGVDLMWLKLKERALPYINTEDLRAIVLEMDEDSKSLRPIVFNDEDWGFSAIDLPVSTRSAEGLDPGSRMVNRHRLVEGFDDTALEKLVVDVLSARCLDGTETQIGWLDGHPVLEVTSRGREYGYALVWPGLAIRLGTPSWVRISIHVVKGPVSLCAVSADGSRFDAEIDIAPGNKPREVLLRLPPLDHRPDLVLRRLEGGTARVGIGPMEVAWETDVHRSAPRAEIVACPLG